MKKKFEIDFVKKFVILKINSIFDYLIITKLDAYRLKLLLNY